MKTDCEWVGVRDNGCWNRAEAGLLTLDVLLLGSCVVRFDPLMKSLLFGVSAPTLTLAGVRFVPASPAGLLIPARAKPKSILGGVRYERKFGAMRFVQER